jgi:hypothetical protein
MRGVTAHESIPAGEIIGEFFGRLDLFGPPCKNGPTHEGYRMLLKTKTTGNKFVGIDALVAGGMMRLVNHSCNQSARFHEVQTGRQLTVVAVTVRDVTQARRSPFSTATSSGFCVGAGGGAANTATCSTSRNLNARED